MSVEYKQKNERVCLFTSTMPDEVGLTNLVRQFSKNNVNFCYELFDIVDINQKNIEKICHVLEEAYGRPDKIVILGSYFDKFVPFFIEKIATKICVFVKGDYSTLFQAPNVEYNNLESCQSVTKWLISQIYFGGIMNNDKFVEGFLNRFKREIECLEDRFRGKNIELNQPFFTGIFELGADSSIIKTAEANLDDKFWLYFNSWDENKYTKVCSLGSSLISYQKRLVVERVEKNHRFITTKKGVKGVVADSPEFINLCHQALHDRFPEQDLTVVHYTKWNEQGVWDVYSFRPQNGKNDQVDVEKIAYSLGGGGNKDMAGATIAASNVLPF